MPVSCPRCLATYPQRVQFCGLCGAEIREAEETIQSYPDPLVGLVVSDRYRILSLLGRGGIGAVYRAEHVAIGKPVALKILHGNLGQRKEVLQRFRREAEAASRLMHIHTVQVFDYGNWRGLAYLVMEYLRGTDLATIIRRDGPMPWSRALSILVQVCDSLEEAHEQNIVHRDIKPENILIVPRAGHPDFVKVVDFGLAKVRDDRSTLDTTGDGAMIGTPFYMAPEQIRGEPVDGRTDVYAMGGVLYRTLTGLPPFEAPTPFAVLTRHLSDRLTPPSVRVPGIDVPPEIDAIVMRAMAKEPGERFQTAREMRQGIMDAVMIHSPSALGAVEVRTPSQVPVASPGLAAGAVRPSAASPPFSFASVLDVAAPGAPAVTPSPGGPPDLSRDEFDAYARRLRARRWLAGIAVTVLLAGGAASAVVVPGLLRSPPGPVIEEVEPNNRLSAANIIALGRQVTGTIGRRISETEGDQDYFRVMIRPMGASVLRANLAGLPGMDLRLDVFGIAGGEPLAEIDAGGPGEGETLAGLLVDGHEYIIRVSEVAREGGVPNERLSDAYVIEVDALPTDAYEGEPNDDPATAIELRAGSPMQGFIEVPRDVDMYYVEGESGSGRVRVTPLGRTDLAVEIGSRTVDDGAAGEPETATLGGSDGRYVTVRLTRKAAQRGAETEAEREEAEVDESRAPGPANPYRIEVIPAGDAS